MNDTSVEALRNQVAATETLLQNLKGQLAKAEQDIQQARRLTASPQINRGNHAPERHTVVDGSLNGAGDPVDASRQDKWPLRQEEYSRYGRQLIMKEIGIRGQLRLKSAKVLIVGVGGLGCPAATYLAGAGVGELGLMDGDTVEVSNLHRQIAHSTDRVGTNKAESARQYLAGLNPLVRYNTHPAHLTPEKAVSIFEQYDLILDCTDHPTSRYLISDACVLAGKPLVSASALRTDGQLIVLNNPPRPAGDISGGPCYRCIFPKPPPAESVISCGDGGVLGPVVGTMGVLQALEAIKVLCAQPSKPTDPPTSSEEEPPKASMLMFSAFNSPQFRTVRLRSRRKDCAVCSSTAYINKASLTSGSLDYVAFCGVATPINVLSTDQRISAADFSHLLNADRGTVIDVRDENQFGICALPHSVNVPWTGDKEIWFNKAVKLGALREDEGTNYILCRFGNDSQLAAKAVMERSTTSVKVKDIRGGLQAWRQNVDPDWPNY